MDLPFTDLTQDWYMDSIRYVYEHELMYGTTDTTFSAGRRPDPRPCS